MAYKVVMPRYGATMEEGIVNSWLVKEEALFPRVMCWGKLQLRSLPMSS